MYTNLENALANFSFLTLFLSMIFFWMSFIFNDPKENQTPGLEIQFKNEFASALGDVNGENNLDCANGRLVPNENSKNYLQTFLKVNEAKGSEAGWNDITSPLEGWNEVTESNRFWNSLNPFVLNAQPRLILMFLANLSLFSLLLLRWVESGHFPLSNLYESLMFLSWCCTTIHLLSSFFLLSAPPRVTLETQKLLISNAAISNGETIMKDATKTLASLQSTTSLLNNNAQKTFLLNLFGSIISPCALLTNAFATLSLPKQMQLSAPLVPALQSNWLMMHVTVMIISYATLIIGSLLAIAFLFITGGNEVTMQNSNNQEIGDKLELNFKGQSTSLPKTLDNLSYRILALGFPFLTIGILSGAVWANEAWGSYWSWDPKETWALLTWLVFAIYLHTRLTKGWNGKKPAIIASIGFITVWICYLGVNLLGEGLHSYGFFS